MMKITIKSEKKRNLGEQSNSKKNMIYIKSKRKVASEIRKELEKLIPDEPEEVKDIKVETENEGNQPEADSVETANDKDTKSKSKKKPSKRKKVDMPKGKDLEEAIQNYLQKQNPDAMIIDVTSKATDEFIKFSPIYPHCGIPVPFSNRNAVSVEGIWQGLKVFENDDIDLRLLSKSDMKGMKRTGSKLGNWLGHRKGVKGEELLGYIEARKLIFLPCYKWVLDNKLQKLVTAIRVISKNKPVILLDNTVNSNVYDPSEPLSHAALIKAYIEGNYPE